MAEDLDLIAASYVTGLARGEARSAIEARSEADLGLRAKIKLWEENLVALDLAADRQLPDHDLFDNIIAAVDAGDAQPLGTLTRRAGTGAWTELSPGVACQILFDDPVSKRRSLLLRMAPGASYQAHPHAHGHEECLVLVPSVIAIEVTF